MNFKYLLTYIYREINICLKKHPSIIFSLIRMIILYSLQPPMTFKSIVHQQYKLHSPYKQPTCNDLSVMVYWVNMAGTAFAWLERDVEKDLEVSVVVPRKEKSGCSRCFVTLKQDVSSLIDKLHIYPLKAVERLLMSCPLLPPAGRPMWKAW